MSAQDIGPLLRSWGLQASELPPADARPEDLAPLLISLLVEAVPFIDSAAPRTSSTTTSRGTSPLWKTKGTKRYPGVDSEVEVLERVISSPELEVVIARNNLPYGRGPEGPIPHETWAGRRSVHIPSPSKGSATWSEFELHFKDQHAEAEQAYTPTITRRRTARKWDCKGVEAEEGGVKWGDFTLALEETEHHIGAILQNRVFATLQMSASAIDASGKRIVGPGAEISVVSVAVPDFGGSDLAVFAKERACVVGSYTAVERVRVMEGGGIEWVMGTVSDAKGVLPKWVQALAVPGQIAKDVQLFLVWVAREREGEGEGEE